jgi:SulP family sulfate permease
VTLGAILFMHRMAQMVEVSSHQPLIEGDTVAESQAIEQDRSGFLAWRVSGPFFFGAASTVGSVLESIGERPRIFALDLSDVPLTDGTGAQTLLGFVEKSARHNTRVVLVGTQPQVRHALEACGVALPLVDYVETLEEARQLDPMVQSQLVP